MLPIKKNASSLRRTALHLFSALTLSALIVPASHAGEAEIKKNIETFIGSPAIDTVKKTPYGNLYEVVLKSGELVYVDDKASFIIDGSIIDLKTRSNVTQSRLNELSAIDFSALPLGDAIKTVRGNGKRIIATFEDPNCGYCKRLGKDLAGMDDVTIYTFLYPILSADSAEKSRNIWCASDRWQAWSDWIVEGKTPAKAECDTAAVERNTALGRKLKVSGTPTLFLADGTRIGGYVPQAKLEEALAKVAGK